MTWQAADVTVSNFQTKSFANYFGTSTTPSSNGTHTVHLIE